MARAVAPVSILRVLTDRGRAFAAFGLVTALAGWLLGWRDVARIGLMLLGLVVLAAVVFPRRHLTMRMQREVFPPRVPFGQRAAVRVTFLNHGRRRTPLLLAQETMDYALGNRPRFAVPGMAPGEARSLVYGVTGGVRGRHSLGPLHVEQQDPFGLTRVRSRMGAAEELIVLPRVVDLPEGGPLSAGTGTEGDIPLMLALHGEDDVSIRAFHEGDDLRRVHWPATAHRGEIMMRQEERPSQRRAILVLDARASAHRGVGASSSLEWAVTAVASAARALDRHGFLVYLVTPETAADGSADHPMDLDQVLYRLAVEPRTTEAGHEHTLGTAARLARDHGLVVMTTAWAHDTDGLPGADIRSRAGLGLRFLIDTPTFEGRPRAATPPAVLPGWHTVVARAGSSHAQAWDRLMSAAAGGGVTA